MAAILANIAKCTFPTIRSITKSFISPLGIWGSPISIRNTRVLAFKSAGISGIPKPPASPPLAARKSSSTQRVSAGTQKKRRSSAPHSLTRGAQFSAPMPSRTERTSPLSIASAMRAIRKMAIRVSTSGEILSSLIRSAKSPPKQAANKRKFSSSNAIRRKVKRHAATGPSSATAASTRINPFSIAGSANDSCVAFPAMRAITELMNAYRECSRNLWNVYFSKRKDIGDALDVFEQIRELLFDSIVLSELSYEGEAEGADIPPPVLKVVPESSSLILIQRLSGPGEAGYWDQEKDMAVGPDDIRLALLAM